MRVRCDSCQQEMDFTPGIFRCTCGGTWEQVFTLPVGLDHIRADQQGLRRYETFFEQDCPLDIDLGSRMTPIVPFSRESLRVSCKLEYFSPTGSYKDRGSAVMLSSLFHAGVTRIIEDSSGNAGASIAAHAARAGIHASIFVPAAAPERKKHQIQQYGATVIAVDGSREDVRAAAWEASREGATLATHALHPAFLTGLQSAGFEIWEQFSGKPPEIIITPIGQGLLFLGVWEGLRRLAEAQSFKLPRLFGIQSEACAPLAAAFATGSDTIIPATPPTAGTLADGIAITSPIRGKRVLSAARESGGGILTVTDEEIREAQARASRSGFLIEFTSAVVVAALDRISRNSDPTDRILMLFTGTGLKNPSS